MIEITAEIRAFIDKAAAGVELAEDEYIDPSDGLIHCKKCGGQRQTVVPCFGKSGYFMPHCICQCQREAEEQRKGQVKLDKEAAALPAEEQPAKPTKFETDKEKLRQTIRTALSSAASYGEFAAVLLQQGVTVKESRWRLSYLTPDRTKPITARKLGDDFDKAAVLVLLTQNAHRAAEQSKAILEYPAAVKKLSQGEKTTKTTPADNTLQRMVDREAKRAEGKMLVP